MLSEAVHNACTVLSNMEHIAGYIGRQSLRSLNHVVNMCAFAYRIIRYIGLPDANGRALIRRVTLEQLYYTGVQVLPIVIPIALIIGSTLIVQFAKLSNHYELGKIIVFLVIRELGPIITALLIILRSATAVTIEISYMNVLNEIKALEMMGINPVRIVCLPRLLGITTAILLLIFVYDLVSIIGGYGVVWAFTNLSAGNFLAQIAHAVSLADIMVGIVKGVCFGVTITITCLYHGFRTKRRFTDIPIGTSHASVECFFNCLVINILISFSFYL